MGNKNSLNMRKIKDGFMQILICFSGFFTIAVLMIIIGFVFYKGIGGINPKFLTNMWDSKTTFVNVERQNESKSKSKKEGYVSSLGITIGIDKEENVYIKNIDSNSPVKKAVNMKNASYKIRKSDLITKAGNKTLKNVSLNEAVEALEGNQTIRLKIIRPGGGILPMLISTLYIIIFSLIIAVPIGILAAIYLNEYAKKGKILNTIRFAIQSLSGIPSIIYGLFGMLVFVQTMKMQYSVMAGSLTLSIILLPTIISTTEEALKAIPVTYRESSLGLGATKLQTNYKVVLPNALPGILVAVILSIGRIVGESAALIWTAGTVAQIPETLTGEGAGAATLTTKLYWLIKEANDLQGACSIAIVLIVLVILLNIACKLVTKRFAAKQGR